MPTFFFDVRSRGRLDVDLEGLDLPDYDAARREAVRGALDVWRDAVLEMRDPILDQLEIRNAQGYVVEVVTLNSYHHVRARDQAYDLRGGFRRRSVSSR